MTDPMSTQTQYPSTNATSAVTVASPALHNYSTVSNHPGIALSTHHHSHLPEPPGYSTSQWYGATTNHPQPPLAPFGMPHLSYPRYPNASGHSMYASRLSDSLWSTIYTLSTDIYHQSWCCSPYLWSCATQLSIHYSQLVATNKRIS